MSTSNVAVLRGSAEMRQSRNSDTRRRPGQSEHPPLYRLSMTSVATDRLFAVAAIVTGLFATSARASEQRPKPERAKCYGRAWELRGCQRPAPRQIRSG